MANKLEERVRLNMLAFRKRKGLSQKKFSEALGWGYHVLPDLEIGKVKWSLLRIDQVCDQFEVPPDYFLMGDEVFEEKTGLLRLLYNMEPEKRSILRQLIHDFQINDYKIIAEILQFVRRFFKIVQKSARKGETTEN